MPSARRGEFEVRFSGSGGQGLILAARILSAALVMEGKRIAQSQGFEPTSRGGLSRSDLLVSEGDVDYPLVTALDYLVVLDQAAAAASDGLIRPGAVVLCDARRVTAPPVGDFARHDLPFCETAIAVGSERVANVLALGALVGVSRICARTSLERALRAGTPKGFLDLNLEALDKGFEMAAGVASQWIALACSGAG